MSDDKLSEDELHDWRSSELYDALKYGTREEVIACLKALDRLDRELLEILVQQLEDSTSSQQRFRNRFQLVSPPGKPPSIAMVPLIRDGIRRFYRQCRDDGLTSKQAIFRTEGAYGVKRALIMQIVSEGKEPE
jgi:hypothetical protein